MPESIINKRTEENIKNYLENKDKKGDSVDVEEIFPESIKKKDSKKTIIAIAIVGIIAVLAGVAYFSFNSGQSSFDEKQVTVALSSSKEVSSGEEFIMEINYENRNEVELTDVKVSLLAPPGFIFISCDPGPIEKKPLYSWNLEKITKKEKGKIKLFGKLIGKKDSEHKFALEMTYKPSNINYGFVSKGDASVKISSTPFDFSVKSKDSINSGDEIEYSIHYKNISLRKFSAMKIDAILPEGFEYKSSEPETSSVKGSDLAWDIKNVDPNSEGNISIKGSLVGGKDEEKKIRASLSALESDTMFNYDSAESSVKISEIPIVISQTINGESSLAADKNSDLEYKIKFKNIGNEGIKGLIVNSELEGNYDFNSIQVVNGSFDGKNKVTWSAFNVPKLAELGAGEEDELSLKIKVNDIFKINGSASKNFILKNKVSIKNFNFDSGSSEIGKTIASNESEVKIKSFPIIKETAYFNDDMRISNSGLIPPEVAEETTYTVHWNLSNLFNDTSGVRVSTILPEYARWTGNYITSDGKVSLGEEGNGSRTEEDISPMIIGDINGGLSDNGFGISYSLTLPEGFKAGDELEFNYIDGSINEKEDCVIMEDLIQKKYYCQVPWKVGLKNYAEKNNYKISRIAMKIDKEDLYYDAKTREVVWLIPKLEANMGIISPAKEVVFQVGITPRESDAGATILIVDKAVVSGYDDFTLSNVSNVDGEITSDLPDDESIGLEEGIVVDPSVTENQ